MTESEWLNCADPTPMLEFLRGKASERKLRLVGVAYCRWIWTSLPSVRLCRAVETSERYADGLCDRKSMIAARNGAYKASMDACARRSIKEWFKIAHAYNAATDCALTGGWYAASCWQTAEEHSPFPTKRLMTGLLREIIHHPGFKPPINPICLTPTVLSLARSAYDERMMPSGKLDPNRLAVLSDALEEAGCDHDDILNHLRSSGSHVRGCWAVDLLLGKE